MKIEEILLIIRLEKLLFEKANKNKIEFIVYKKKNICKHSIKYILTFVICVNIYLKLNIYS